MIVIEVYLHTSYDNRHQSKYEYTIVKTRCHSTQMDAGVDCEIPIQKGSVHIKTRKVELAHEV